MQPSVPELQTQSMLANESAYQFLQQIYGQVFMNPFMPTPSSIDSIFILQPVPSLPSKPARSIRYVLHYRKHRVSLCKGKMCDYSEVTYQCGHVRYLVLAWCIRYQQTHERCPPNVVRIETKYGEKCGKLGCLPRFENGRLT